jgi:hypothetical protein
VQLRKSTLPEGTLKTSIVDSRPMNLTNDSYVILISTKTFTERYYRDRTGWLKASARGRTFRMTAEQVLNHLLPALAGIKPNLTIMVEHHDDSSKRKRTRGVVG